MTIANPTTQASKGFIYGAILLAALQLPLNGATIFSQGAPNSNSIDMTSYRLADDFTLAQAATITGINFWYTSAPESNLTTVSWAIYNSTANAPGTLIGSGNSPVATAAFFNIYIAALSTSSVNLAAGTYWLELHSGSSLTGTSGPQNFWVFATDNATSLALFNNGAGFPNSPINPGSQGYGQFAFELIGTTGVSGVPEPATYAMLAAGLGLIALRRGIR